MLLGGIRRNYTFASMSQDIPRQWDDFVKLGTLPSRVGRLGYGAICGGDPKTQTMEYMCAGFRSANTPDFELYDERFDGATGDGGVEIWLGIAE